MAASTASTWRRSDSDSVHSQKRDQASSRERGSDMGVTLAQPRGGARRRASGGRAPMEKFVIEGGVPLSGTVVPAGNKNAALPLLAACLLTEEEVVLHNVPEIRDTEAMIDLLVDLGVTATRHGEGRLTLNASGVRRGDVDPDLAER